jgi:hypothetical protein
MDADSTFLDTFQTESDAHIAELEKLDKLDKLDTLDTLDQLDKLDTLDQLDKLDEKADVATNDDTLTFHLIFLTDKHSAKEVIRREFEEQEGHGKLKYLQDKTTEFITADEDKSPKFVREYRIGRFRLVVMIGTVASFMCCVAPSEPPNGCERVSDIFIQKYINLKVGGVRDMFVEYGEQRIRLCQRVKVYVDEAQDLPSLCAEAMCRLQQDTHIRLYVVGDVIQALSEPDNVMTHFATNNANVLYHKKPFDFRRGAHPAFPEFMRAVIPYEKYGCPQPEPWTPNSARRQAHHHNPIIYTPIHKMYVGDDNKDNVLNNARHVCNLVQMFVERENYLPEDFIIPLGYVTKNVLAAQIENLLIDFFDKKLKTDHAYRRIASERSEYWKTMLVKNEWTPESLCVFHKSEDGKPIDTKLSDHGVRMVSIFAAKGDGRHVSIVVGVSEFRLRMYRDHPTVYDSLLNVAVTRAKHYMVWVYENKCDDIYKKMTKYEQFEHHTNPNIKNPQAEHRVVIR